VTVPDPDGIQPRWSLKGFTRVSLDKGNSTSVSFKLDREELEQFDLQGKTSVIPGTYTVHVGNVSPGARGQELGGTVLSARFEVR